MITCQLLVSEALLICWCIFGQNLIRGSIFQEAIVYDNVLSQKPGVLVRLAKDSLAQRFIRFVPHIQTESQQPARWCIYRGQIRYAISYLPKFSAAASSIDFASIYCCRFDDASPVALSSVPAIRRAEYENIPDERIQEFLLTDKASVLRADLRGETRIHVPHYVMDVSPLIKVYGRLGRYPSTCIWYDLSQADRFGFLLLQGANVLQIWQIDWEDQLSTWQRVYAGHSELDRPARLVILSSYILAFTDDGSYEIVSEDSDGSFESVGSGKIDRPSAIIDRGSERIVIQKNASGYIVSLLEISYGKNCLSAGLRPICIVAESNIERAIVSLHR